MYTILDDIQSKNPPNVPYSSPECTILDDIWSKNLPVFPFSSPECTILDDICSKNHLPQRAFSFDIPDLILS